MSRPFILKDLSVESKLSEDVVSIGEIIIATITCSDGRYTMETMSDVNHGLRSIEDCLNYLVEKLNSH